MATQIEDPTFAAYELLAPFYDLYTHDYEHDCWLANIEAAAIGHGLSGRRLLDVGCGTGKSFLPLLGRGYDVTACDLSPGMVERAREAAAGTGAEVLVADARDLPELGSFDLTIALDDALNYMLSDEELGSVFDGVARNMRPGGLFVFDLNSLYTYRNLLARDMAMEVGDAFFCWRGEERSEEMLPGSVAASVIEVFATEDGGSWQRYSSRHVQRHHPPATVERLLRGAGLQLLSRRGQMTGTQIDAVGDDDLHVKLLYFARKGPGRPNFANRMTERG
jgi:SAM-dependent methyltransferase